MEVIMDLSSRAPNDNERFLWLAPFAPPEGFTRVPAGGICLCVFLFIIQGSKILLGRYRRHPAWETLTGMDTGRVEANRHGLTLPASHLKFGEDPLVAARRIGEDMITLSKGLTYSQPFVQTFFYEPVIAPCEMHFDVLFFYDVALPGDVKILTPPWYASLKWIDKDKLLNQKYARQHGDVVSAWLNKRSES
jgi:ADP-ribose pyrophosphatase YjhB (NUDIX family)